jgi:hypothetical protein
MGGQNSGFAVPWSSQMAKTDPKLYCFLAQGAFSSPHKLRDLSYRRSGLRMLFQQFEVSRSIRLAC